MGLDDVFIAMLVGGIGLSIAYLVAEYHHWRTQGAAQRRREALQRELHAARLAQNEAPPPAPIPSASVEIAWDLPERRGARPASQRFYPFVERRKRATSRESAGGSIGRNA
jgi:hypothetical protein